MPREDFSLLRVPTRTVDHAQLVKHSRESSNILNDVRDGKLNCVGEVTLTASAATTTVTDMRVRAASTIFLMATTANAALALAPAGQLSYTFGTVALDTTPESTDTFVTDANVLATSKIVLMPLDTNSAAEVAGLFDLDDAYLIVYDIADGGFTIHHAPETAVARTFDYVNFLAAAPSGTPAYVSSVLKHQFVITHANNAQTDRTFRYVVLG